MRITQQSRSVAAVALMIAFASATLLGQASGQTISPEEKQRIQDIYVPSAAHRELSRLEGKWEQTSEYASGPGAVTQFHGLVVNRLILGGRFLVSEGAVRQVNGDLTIESMLVFGFDGRIRQFTSLVFDTFGTYYVSAAGASDRPAKRIVMSGETLEGKNPKRFDVVLEWLGADEYRIQIIFHHADKSTPTVAVSSMYRRAK